MPERKLHLDVTDEELERRRAAKGEAPWYPVRDRKVSKALRAYASMATSASYGAVRQVD